MTVTTLNPIRPTILKALDEYTYKVHAFDGHLKVDLYRVGNDHISATVESAGRVLMHREHDRVPESGSLLSLDEHTTATVAPKGIHVGFRVAFHRDGKLHSIFETEAPLEFRVWRG